MAEDELINAIKHLYKKQNIEWMYLKGRPIEYLLGVLDALTLTELASRNMKLATEIENLRSEI